MAFTLFLKWHDRYQLAIKGHSHAPLFIFLQKRAYNTVGVSWAVVKEDSRGGCFGKDNFVPRGGGGVGEVPLILCGVERDW